MSNELERFTPVTDIRPDDVAWPEMVWPIAPGTTLSGPAVTLTQVDPGTDAAALFAALDHDADWRHVAGRPLSPADFAARIVETRAAGRVTWVVRLLEPVAGLNAGAVVGMSSYLDVSPSDARLEIGWTAYTPAVWGSAVNPQTKFLLLSHAFEELNAGRVQIKTDARNVRSQQAIARLGAEYEGTLRRYQRRSDGTVRDTVLFSISAERWPAVREALLLRLG